MKKLLLILIAICFTLSASAQYRRGWYRMRTKARHSVVQVDTAAGSRTAHNATARLQKSIAPALLAIEERFADTLTLMRQIMESSSANAKLQSSSTNPYYYRLFVNPLIYRHSLRQAIRLAPLEQDSIASAKDNFVLETDSVLNDFFVNVYLEHPEIVNNTDVVLDNTGHIRRYDDKRHAVEKVDVNMSENVKPMTPDVVIEPIEAVSRKPNFWKFKADVSGKLLQNYASDNWYQGESNYNSWMVSAVLKANYNNKRKVSWENTLQMELGFQSDKNDTEHKYKTYTDNVRLTNKLGLQASKHWFYTTSLVSWTQFYPKYDNNSTRVKSDFMSPFESVLSIGMDYKNNKKGFDISIGLNPLSYDFKFVDRSKLRANYGTKNHHSMEAIGYNVQLNMGWQLFKELKWQCRFYYFSNLKKIQCEWENTFYFTINKYLNTELKLYPRFDDSFRTNKSNAVLQFKEYLALSVKVSF